MLRSLVGSEMFIRDSPYSMESISAAELKTHNKPTDLWICINGQVLDVTKYQDKHPGSAMTLIACGGQDATQRFNQVGHDHFAMTIKEELVVGFVPDDELELLQGHEPVQTDHVNLVMSLGSLGGIIALSFQLHALGDGLTNSSSTSVFASLAALVLLFAAYDFVSKKLFKAVPALSADYKKFRVTSASNVTSEADRETMFIKLGVSTTHIPTGQHVQIRAHVGDEVVERKFTPTRFDGRECELLVRVVKDGALTPVLAQLKEGDMVEMRGPVGSYTYGLSGPGSLQDMLLAKRYVGVSQMLMLAGGTGITPMLQIVNHVLADAEDSTHMVLVCFNKSMGEAMLAERISGLAKQHPEQLKVVFAVSTVEAALGESSECVAASMRDLTMEELKAIVPELHPEGHGSCIGLVCGPDGFCKAATALCTTGGIKNTVVW
eukprot:TRINITY_DN5024_c0_g1_i1.p1 TRINITY_DN5024_c0_g1~~TRINITY_DN5024_c0_g1_i1.p1  ORF type:complete len:435 (-),score=149.40 TRINITY_DN5024_c0_g1_i1:312-1616(-)